MNSIDSFLDRITHGDCTEVMRRIPSGSIDLVVTDPPYLSNYRPRDGRNIVNDNNREWLRPAFAQIFRVLKPDSFCFSFYGWPHAERFLWTWKDLGFAPVSHFSFVKEYSSKEGYSASHHEVGYLLVKGRPPKPEKPIRDVLPWDYTGNALHPAQKPVSVIKTLIEAYSRHGDIVLDPFAGSGTTGIAARESRRKFVLIEKAWDCYATAHHRLTGERIN